MSKRQHNFKVPTQFLSRASLRVEGLIDILRQASTDKNILIHRYALKSLIDLIDVIEKPELKSRFLKEFIRIEYVLEKSHSAIEPELLNNLRSQIQKLSQSGGSFSDLLIQDNFLKDIRQLYQPGAKDCEFSSPQLQIWLEQALKSRQQILSEWLDCLNDLEQTVQLYFDLLTATAFEDQIIAENGYCHYGLSSKSNCHLLILTLLTSENILPKIQLGHHGLSLRLYDFQTMTPLKDVSVEIDIQVCQI